MSKKVLVLTGSPRVGGNTEILADAFVKGAQAVGHVVMRFDAGRKEMKGCKACNACYSNGSACPFDEDFSELAPMIEAADTIAFITPIYWFSFPTQIKAAIDKLYALLVGQRKINVKETLLIVCGEMDDTSIFEPVVSTYRTISGYMQWQDAGTLVVPAVLNEGDVRATDFPAKAEAMGREL